jgi:hypothetical protein
VEGGRRRHIFDVARQWHTFTAQTEAQFQGGGRLTRRLSMTSRSRGKPGRALKHKMPLDAVYQLQHASSGYHYMTVRYVPVFDKRQRLREWVVWMADIDARVRAGRERSHFFTLSLDLLCVTD